MSAVAALLEDEGEIARGIDAFSRRSVAHGGREWTSEGVRAGAGLRLYRAVADTHWMLAKDGQPDHRVPVPVRAAPGRGPEGSVKESRTQPAPFGT